ncbi:hypothetical protein CAEBREN_26229 [Caenorhabditis brenneri]|uniref:Uncharacterized protein n=1 Tax=Caenorhabditis brenneri TaxID=135651 RepID=G0N1Y0_CAEBE|nr:hypothetical protein CAEBREN_26229 [Caenorhabditis brenneri]
MNRDHEVPPPPEEIPQADARAAPLPANRQDPNDLVGRIIFQMQPKPSRRRSVILPLSFPRLPPVPERRNLMIKAHIQPSGTRKTKSTTVYKQTIY